MGPTLRLDSCCCHFVLFAFCVYCLVGGAVCWVFPGWFGGFVFGAEGCIVVVVGVSSCGMLSCSYGGWRLRGCSPCLRFYVGLRASHWPPTIRARYPNIV